VRGAIDLAGLAAWELADGPVHATHPAVLQTVASQDRGIAGLWEAIERACSGAMPRQAPTGE